MSTRFSYKTKGHLSQKELEGLHKLCREEEDVKWATLNLDKELSDYYHKLLVYFKVNKFKLFEANEALLDRYKEYRDKYDFIVSIEYRRVGTVKAVKEILPLPNAYSNCVAGNEYFSDIEYTVI